MSHRAPFNSRSGNSSPAPVLIPAGQYGASSGRSSSPYGNLAARSGIRGVNTHTSPSDTRTSQPSPLHPGGPYAANTRDVVPRFTESPYQADSYSRTAQQLEHQNDDKLEGLMSKVRILKDVSDPLLTLRVSLQWFLLWPQVTIGIGDEVRQSNMELGNMVCPKEHHVSRAHRSPFVCGYLTE